MDAISLGNIKLFVILTWVLSGLSISSCLIRNDYNVVFSFLMLAIFNNFFKENSKFYSKILIHLLVGLVLVDTIWLIVIMPYWNSKSPSKNPYWDSLSTIHTFTLIVGFLELFLKLALGAVIFIQYKKNNPNDIGDLLKFNYSSVPQQISKILINFLESEGPNAPQAN